MFQIDERMRAMYEQKMKDWKGCEAIVRQREREKHAEALARCSSGASVERGPVQRDSTISTDASLFSLACNVVRDKTNIMRENYKEKLFIIPITLSHLCLCVLCGFLLCSRL